MIIIGASSFIVSSNGHTASEAFTKAVAEAKYEHGYGGYTGTIAEKNTFKIIPCPDSKDMEDFYDYIYDYIDKHNILKDDPAYCIVISEGKTSTIIPSKVKTEKFINKGNRVWESLYVGYNSSKHEVVKSKYLDSAEDMAKAYALEYQDEVDVVLEKRLVNSSPLVRKITPVPVVSNAVLGTYLFFGLAAD